MPLQIRRGPTADRNAITPVEGELIWDTQLEQLFIGNGSTAGGIAAANFTAEEAQDASADLFTSHSDHEGVSFAYDDVLNKVVATVSQDLSNYQGVIGADGFKGSVFADDSQILVDGVLGSFNLNGTIRSHIVPAADSVYDLGTSGNKFRDLYLSGSSLFLGDATITSTGTAVNLPAGSTIGGSTIGTGAEIVNGTNFNINIVGDDSTLVVDSATATFNGTLNGDVIGSVFRDDSTPIVDAIDGTLTGSLVTSSIQDAGGLGKVFVDTTQGTFIRSEGEQVLRINGLKSGGSIPKIQLHVVSGSFESPATVSPGDVTSQLVFSTYFDSAGDDIGKSLASLLSQMDSSATASDNAPASNLAFSISAGDGEGDVANDYHQFTMYYTGAFESKIVKYAEQDASKISSITPLAGMVIFNSDTQKYQGYVDDTGLAGGGVSNGTPGWINLH